MQKNLLLLFIFLTISFQSSIAQEITYTLVKNISYIPESETSEYANERCKLDLYYPENTTDFVTVVWFHGGGLTGGEKSIPATLKEKGIAVVAVNYRLSPKVKSPVYIEDAAAAVAWTFNNIEKYGGSKEKIVVSGHSAGGYLSSMIGLDKHYLAKFNVDADDIALLVPFSGHTITHFTVRKERGIEGTQPVVDELAPLYFVRADAPPLVLITGDRELEMLGRYEENAYMYRMMKVAGHQHTKLLELDGFDHGGMASPALELLLKEIKPLKKQ
ncbi:alpha/beta hydrolase [Maribellus luteus]|uniref:Alpha/beta hydrolase n=1 Tax=Maribellus luteus TaxID=2305463 RepID=A0A399SUH2_9BACT|nr:alpha/beta hydrolase [Maribellus luteus]RIJ46061.1 alpha/beta hydrolase [Maribellus luteus]